MKELKDRYKKDFELMRTAMNEFDPCGLIALECPIDEYDHLTNKVFGLRHRKELRGKIKETILFELTDYFRQDVQSLKEPYKTKFYQALDKFLDDTEAIRKHK
jgi:hypothetical protein